MIYHRARRPFATRGRGLAEAAAAGRFPAPAAADGARHWLTLIPRRHGQLGRPFGPELLSAALAAAGNLAAAGPRPAVLLHGDFHRGNVLAGARARWLAIDPCPAAGDREYDVADLAADFLDEHTGQPGAGRRLAAVLAGLGRVIPGLDRGRLRDWMLAKRIVLALESIAAAGDAEWDLAFARLLLAGPADPGAVRAGPESRA